MAISEDIWTSDEHRHTSWQHYSSTKQDKFRPVNLPTNDCFKTSLGTNKSPTKSKVCRSLFGPVDPIENKRLVYEHFNSQRYMDRNRWNFDFHQEKPLSGRYDWRKVCATSNDCYLTNRMKTITTGEHHKNHHYHQPLIKNNKWYSHSAANKNFNDEGKFPSIFLFI